MFSTQRLEWNGSELALKRHDRLDFYNKREKTTAEFAKRVAGMAPGTPVLLGIADTACAASRPLQGGFYSALAKLGAPADMPKIEYRAAWAMVGFKGAQPGVALTAMGTRQCSLQCHFNMTLYESMRATLVSRSRELVQR